METGPAWEPIHDEHERYWVPFDDRYAFRPKFGPDHQPGFTEPRDSVTFSLAPIFRSGSEATFGAGAAALNAEALRAFVQVFDTGERLVVLDWQHPCYRYRPHVHAEAGDTWVVSPFPDGDYSVFLNDDMSVGTFGHPWEESLCVFGTALVDALAPALATWLPVLRRGGVAV